jgi:hypothetical protein
LKCHSNHVNLSDHNNFGLFALLFTIKTFQKEFLIKLCKPEIKFYLKICFQGSVSDRSISRRNRSDQGTLFRSQEGHPSGYHERNETHERVETRQH